ncbi:MAG TPA: hypothetical protein VLA62_04905 [Solirubrobacterales bacterium]|nr:hypothetical protein [Solirubrobacterales bacterium]
MSCDIHAHDLPDVALGVVASTELAAHLEGCSACRAEVNRLVSLQARIEDGLGGLLGEEPSPGFVARVRQRLDGPAPERRGLGWLLPAAAAVAGVALGVRLLSRPADTPPSATPSQAVLESPAPAAAQQARVEPIRPPQRRVVRPRPDQPAAAPEVLVPREQQELLQRLVRAMGEEPVAVASWSANGAAPTEVGRIDVAPIQVVPLALESNHVKPLRMENGEGAS